MVFDTLDLRDNATRNVLVVEALPLKIFQRIHHCFLGELCCTPFCRLIALKPLASHFVSALFCGAHKQHSYSMCRTRWKHSRKFLLVVGVYWFEGGCEVSLIGSSRK